MEYESPDSSGRTSSNGRLANVSRGSFSKVQNEMKTQIHHIEKEAYWSVLRAFKAQSDAITWEKESMITGLRKELRVSDDEHIEILSMVNGDNMIGRKREWKGSDSHPDTNLLAIQTISGSRKRQKSSLSVEPGTYCKGIWSWRAKRPVVRGGGVTGAGRWHRRSYVLSKSDFSQLQNGIAKKAHGSIELLRTETLINKVDNVFNASQPHITHIQKAKTVLKDQEQALVDAIAMLEDISDSESGNN